MGMDGTEPAPAFIDNGNAPEFFADGLHDVEVIGQTCRFLLFQFRRSEGIWIKEPVFYARMPLDAVGPAVSLTLRRTAIIPAVEMAWDMARNLVRH